MRLGYILQAAGSVKTSSRNQQLLFSHRLAERPNPGRVSFNCLFRWRWSWFLWGLLCKRIDRAGQHRKSIFTFKINAETRMRLTSSYPGFVFYFERPGWMWMLIVVLLVWSLRGQWCNDRSSTLWWLKASHWLFGTKVSSDSSLFSDFSNRFSAASISVAVDL